MKNIGICCWPMFDALLNRQVAFQSTALLPDSSRRTIDGVVLLFFDTSMADDKKIPISFCPWCGKALPISEEAE